MTCLKRQYSLVVISTSRRPKNSLEAPKRFQDDPKTFQDCPGRSQEGPEKLPRLSKTPPGRLHDASKTTQKMGALGGGSGSRFKGVLKFWCGFWDAKPRLGAALGGPWPPCKTVLKLWCGVGDARPLLGAARGGHLGRFPEAP